LTWRKTLVSFLFLAGLILVVSSVPALADEQDVLDATRNFTTYGGTGKLIADSFQRLSLIMLHPQFQNGYYVAMLLAFLIGGVMTSLKQLGTLNAGLVPWLSWFGSIVMGMLVAGVFFMPTTSMNVWDATTNELHVVPNVPHGIVITAGLFNDIETGFINFVDVVGLDGMTYASGAGGIGLSAVANVFSGFPDSSTYPTSLSSTLTQYIQNCVLFEIYRPGTTLSVDNFYTPNNNDLTQALGLADSPALFTQYYGDDTAGNPTNAGVQVTCNVAWHGGTVSGLSVPGLRNELSNITAVNFWNQQCAATGFNINNSFAMTRCRSLIHSTLDRMLDGVGTLAGNTNNPAGDLNLVRNIVIARAMSTAIQTSDMTTQIRLSSNERITSSGIGIGLTANDYIPLLKAIVLSMFLGLFPFLCFLLPTPLFGRVLSILFGSFCFMCMWTVCDAVVNAMSLDRATDVFQQIQGDQLGLANMFLLPSMSMKALSMFGYMRFMAMMFAGAITSMLIKFGGVFLSSFAGRVGGNVSGVGASAGEETVEPGKHSSRFRSYTDAPSDLTSQVQTVANMGGNLDYTWARSDQKTFGLSTDIKSTNRAIDELGGMNQAISTASEAKAFSQVFQTGEALEGISTSDNLMKTWDNFGGISGAFKYGDTAGKHLAASDQGKSASEASMTTAWVDYTQKLSEADTLRLLEANVPWVNAGMGAKTAYTKAASYAMQRIANSFTKGDGTISRDDAAIFSLIAAQPGGLDVLRAEASKFNAAHIGISDENHAISMQKAIRKHGGMDIGMKDLLGHNVTMSWGVTDDGNIRILNVNSSSGYRAINDAMSTTNIGDSTNYHAPLDYRGPFAAWNQVTNCAAKKGSLDPGVMSENSDRMMTFASKLSSEFKSFYSGSNKNIDSSTFTKGLEQALGFNTGIFGKLMENMGYQNIDQFQSLGESDPVAGKALYIIASGINDGKSDEEISMDLLSYREELLKAGDEMSNAHTSLNPGQGTSPVDMAFSKWVHKNTDKLNSSDRKLLENDQFMLQLRDAWIKGKSDDELRTLKDNLSRN
jgi:hypothetical protein